MKLERLNPFIRYANMHKVYTAPRGNNVCYDCRLFYIAVGEGGLSADGTVYAVPEGSVVFLPPESRYRFSFFDPTAVRIYVLDFDLVDDYSSLPRSLSTVTEDEFSPENVPRYDIPEPFRRTYVIPDAIDIGAYVARAVETILNREPYSTENASAIIKLALLSILTSDSHGGGSRGVVNKLTEYIRRNYSSVGLSNEEIAARLHYHPYYLSRVIKSHTGMTLRGYIMDYRLRMAKNYLITTQDSVTDIAEACGFASYTYFIKAFRECVGVSPLRYRRSHERIGL